MATTRRSRIAPVEALEGRLQMATQGYIHLGPMTKAAEAAIGSATLG